GLLLLGGEVLVERLPHPMRRATVEGEARLLDRLGEPIRVGRVHPARAAVHGESGRGDDRVCPAPDPGPRFHGDHRQPGRGEPADSRDPGCARAHHHDVEPVLHDASSLPRRGGEDHLRRVGLSRSSWSTGITTRSGRLAFRAGAKVLASPATMTLAWAGSITRTAKACTWAGVTASTRAV